MKVEEYREKFLVDGKLKSEDFLKAFALEFNSRLSSVKDYNGFNNLVSDMMVKFQGVRGVPSSNKPLKRHIKDKLWKAFFAIYVVPQRKARFPEEQSRIEDRRINWFNPNESN